MEREELLAGLRAEDVRTRATTIGNVRQTDLDDMDVLDAFLVVARDHRALPDDMQPPEAADPFADFFGASFTGAKSGSSRRSVADSAGERLVFTGVIGKTETAEHLAAALADPECGEALATSVVKVLGETQWADRVEATRLLVPLLHAHDVAMYAVVVRFGEEEHAIMIDSALSPYSSRAVNELLNHQLAKPAMERALRDGVVDGTIELSEQSASDLLTLLVAWDSPYANEASVVLQERWPWALLVRAIDDAEAGPGLAAWLAQGHGAPLGLVRKLQEALKTRDDLPHYPIAAWLGWAGTGVDVIRQWGVAGRCREVLEGFVRQGLVDGEAPERAWESIAALVEAGEHDGIQTLLDAALRDPDQVEHLTRALLETLATAEPRIPGLIDTLAATLAASPESTRAVLPALQTGYEPEALRPLVEQYIALCESRPVVRKPSRPGLIHEEREGVDPVPLQSIVSFLRDDSLRQRLEAVLPFVRPEG